MAEKTVDPFDIEFDDTDEQPKKRNPNMLWEKTKSRVPELKKELEQPEEETLGELPELDVPEIDTHVEDLPEGNENEKELVVEHNDNTIVGDPDKTQLPEEPEEEGESTVYDQSLAENPVGNFSDRTNYDDVGGEPFDDNDVIPEPDDYEQNFVDPEEVGLPKSDEDEYKEPEEVDEKKEKIMNELRALAQDDLTDFKYDPNIETWTAKQKQDALKSYLENKKNKEPPKKIMTEEEVMKEARTLAQDDLEGIEIDPAIWSEMTTEEKLEFIKMLQEKNKKNTTNNNFEAYKRYPTALKVAENVQQGVHNILNRAEDAANQNLAGGQSINNTVGRAAIPHYDYRSFFK